jgi:ribosomal protein L11 methyltransferase
MIKNIKKNNVVLDYGCGSGILAICAKKLGASAVTGVDIDPQAIIASEQNAKSNQTDITFKNSQEKLIVRADLVIANILSSALKVLAPALARYCLPNGKIALSGILKHQENEIKDIYSEWFVMQKSYYKDGWVCLSGKKV